MVGFSHNSLLSTKLYHYDSRKKEKSYKGELKGHLRHGAGTYIYNSYFKYQGDWKEGRKHGKGTS